MVLVSMQVTETFQAVISTDGNASFAILTYNNPLGFSPYLTDPAWAVGFDSGSLRQGSFTNLGKVLVQNNQNLESSNIFRIDGMQLPRSVFVQSIHCLNVLL